MESDMQAVLEQIAGFALFISGFVLAGASLTFGMALVCQLLGWAPVNITIHNNERNR
jgi:hypothetical protein